MRRRPLPAPKALVTFFAVITALSAAAPAPAPAQSTSALINEALDKQVNLDLNDTLPGALQAIQTKTGVPIKPDPSVYDLLPWGENTNITAKIQNQTLRQALDAITQKLGLSFTLGDEAILLQPVPALRRLPHRATVQELRALDLLAATKMPPVKDNHVQTFLSAIDLQLDALKSPFAVENRLSADPRNLNQ